MWRFVQAGEGPCENPICIWRVIGTGSYRFWLQFVERRRRFYDNHGRRGYNDHNSGRNNNHYNGNNHHHNYCTDDHSRSDHHYDGGFG